jgi:hypothetical protein
MLRLRRPLSEAGSIDPSVTVALTSAGAFFAVYSLAWASGMRFSTRYVDEGWQLAPREILERDPLGTVWNLHIQPPMWNLTIGSTMRLSPLPDALSLQLVMLALAVLVVWLLADIVWMTTRRRWLATTLPLVAMLHPDVLANALEPRYELAVTLFLTIICWSCIRLSSPTWLLAVVSSVATLTVMTRALYHPVWLLGLLGLMGWIFRRTSRRRWLAATVPGVCLVALWMLKNLVLFGTFSLSSWTGMNLLRSVEPVVDDRAMIDLFETGEISGVAFVGPFEDLSEYAPFVAPCRPEHDHPALTVVLRPTTPVPVANFNNECYLPIFAAASDDARSLIRAEPRAWLQGRLESVEAFATRSVDLRANDSIIVRLLADTYRILDVQLPGTVTVRLLSELNESIQAPTTYATISTTAVAVVAGASLWLLRRRSRLALAAAPGLGCAVLILGGTIWWTFVTGVVGELGEQARFRTGVQPIAVVICGSLVHLYLRARRQPTET